MSIDKNPSSSAPSFNPQLEGDKLAMSKLKGNEALHATFLSSAGLISNTLDGILKYNNNSENRDKKDLYFTNNGWKGMTKTERSAFMKQPGAIAHKFSKSDVKRLLAADGVVRQTLTESKAFVVALTRTLKLESDNPLKNLAIKVGCRDKTAAFSERHWAAFSLEQVVHKPFDEVDHEHKAFAGIVELQRLERSENKEDTRETTPLDSFTKRALDPLDLSPLRQGVVATSGSAKSSAVPADHQSLRDAEAAPYTDAQNPPSGAAAQHCRCKQQLDKNSEVCGDYVRTEHHSSHSVSVVMDAAGNDPSCHEGARKLGDALTEGLNVLVAKYGNDPAKFKEELGKLLNDLHKQHSIDTKAQADGKQQHTPVTAAFALRINLNDGKQLAITGTIGDARVLHQKGTGEVHNKSNNIYYKSYEDSGGALGYENMSKYNAPDALVPVQMDAFLLEKGDRIILGSDGMGDNLEARRLGVSPKAAAQALKEAGRLPEGVDINALSDDIKEWKVKPRDNDKLQQMQKVHNAFIEYQAEVIINKGQKDNQAPGAALFAHCTENPAVRRGAERVKIEYRMEELRREAQASLENKVANSQDFTAKREELRCSTKEELKEVVVENRRSSFLGKVKDGFAQVITPQRRQEALDREAETMLTAGTEELSQKARDIRAEQDKKMTAAKLEIRNILVGNGDADINRINGELTQRYEELVALGEAITKEHPELEGEWEAALKAQGTTQEDYQNSWKTDYAVSPVAHICDGPVNTFIQTYSMKPDDVAISTLDSQSVEVEQKAKPSLKQQNLQRRQSIAEWEEEPEVGNVKAPPMPKVEDNEYLI